MPGFPTFGESGFIKGKAFSYIYRYIPLSVVLSWSYYKSNKFVLSTRPSVIFLIVSIQCDRFSDLIFQSCSSDLPINRTNKIVTTFFQIQNLLLLKKVKGDMRSYGTSRHPKLHLKSTRTCQAYLFKERSLVSINMRSLVPSWPPQTLFYWATVSSVLFL